MKEKFAIHNFRYVYHINMAQSFIRLSEQYLCEKNKNGFPYNMSELLGLMGLSYYDACYYTLNGIYLNRLKKHEKKDLTSESFINNKKLKNNLLHIIPNVKLLLIQ